MAELAHVLRRHRQIGLDTSVFIYHLEGTSRYAAIANGIFDELELGGFEGLASVLTLMELIVKPLQLEKLDVAAEYEVLLVNYPHLRVVDIDRATARRAAALRARHRLRPADALQVASSLRWGATAFLTNDADLRRVTELEVILLEDLISG